MSGIDQTTHSSDEEKPIAESAEDLLLSKDGSTSSLPPYLEGRLEQCLKFLTDIQFERIVYQLLDREKTERGFTKVILYGKQHDRGRDAVAIKMTSGGKHYFQCKQTATLQKTLLEDEIIKILFHSVGDGAFAPENYTFVVSGDLSNSARDAIEDRSRLISGVANRIKKGKEKYHKALSKNNSWSEAIQRISIDYMPGHELARSLTKYPDIFDQHFTVAKVIDQTATSNLNALSGIARGPLLEERVDALKWRLSEKTPLVRPEINRFAPLLRELASKSGSLPSPEETAHSLKISTVSLETKPDTKGSVFRKELVDKICREIEKRKNLLLYGYPKIGKSLLASQLIDALNCGATYWWYSLLDSGGDDKTRANEVLWNLLSFMNQFVSCQDLANDVFQNKVPAREAIRATTQLLKELPSNVNIAICLDNIQVIASQTVLEELLSELSKLNSPQVVVLMLSDRKSLPSVIPSDISYMVPGFEAAEIKELFRLKGITLPSFVEKHIEIIRSLIDGHPVTALVLVPFLKKIGTPDDLMKFISELKKITDQDALTKLTYEKLYNHWLDGSFEQTLFTRLAALFYPFDESVMLAVGSIDPKIVNPLICIEKLKQLVLEPHGGNKFLVPKFYRDCGIRFLPDEERKAVLTAASKALLVPQGTTLNADNVMTAVDYFVLAGEFNRALRWAGFLLMKVHEGSIETYRSILSAHFSYIKPLDHPSINTFTRLFFLIGMAWAELEVDPSRTKESIDFAKSSLDKLKNDVEKKMIELAIQGIELLYFMKSNKFIEAQRMLAVITRSQEAKEAGVHITNEIEMGLALQGASESTNIDDVRDLLLRGYEERGHLSEAESSSASQVYDKYVLSVGKTDYARVKEELSQHLKSYESNKRHQAQVIVLNALGLLEFEVANNREGALNFTERAISLAEGTNGSDLKAVSHMLRGDLFFEHDDEKSLTEYERVIFLSGMKCTFSCGFAFYRIGLIRAKTALNRETLSCFLKAYRRFWRAGYPQIALQALGEFADGNFVLKKYQIGLRALLRINRKARQDDLMPIFLLASNTVTWLDYTLSERPIPEFLNFEKKTKILSPEIGRYRNINFKAPIENRGQMHVTSDYMLGNVMVKAGQYRRAILVLGPLGKIEKAAMTSLERSALVISKLKLAEAYLQTERWADVIPLLRRIIDEHVENDMQPDQIDAHVFSTIVHPALSKIFELSLDDGLSKIEELKAVFKSSKTRRLDYWENILSINASLFELAKDSANWKAKISKFERLIEEAKTAGFFDNELNGRLALGFQLVQYFSSAHSLMQYQIETLKRIEENNHQKAREHFGPSMFRIWNSIGFRLVSASEIAKIDLLKRNLSNTLWSTASAEQKYRIAARALIEALNLTEDSEWSGIYRRLQSQPVG